MLEKALLMFPSASERRLVDSHVHEGGQTIFKCYESSIQGELHCWEKCPSEQCRCLKHKEENCGVKHPAKTRELWISFPSMKSAVWVCSWQCCWLCLSVWPPRARGAEAAAQRGHGVKAGGVALPSAGTADVPQQGPTSPGAERINRHCWNAWLLPFCLSFLKVFFRAQVWP